MNFNKIDSLIANCGLSDRLSDARELAYAVLVADELRQQLACYYSGHMEAAGAMSQERFAAGMAKANAASAEIQRLMKEKAP